MQREGIKANLPTHHPRPLGCCPPRSNSFLTTYLVYYLFSFDCFLLTTKSVCFTLLCVCMLYTYVVFVCMCVMCACMCVCVLVSVCVLYMQCVFRIYLYICVSMCFACVLYSVHMHMFMCVVCVYMCLHVCLGAHLPMCAHVKVRGQLQMSSPIALPYLFLDRVSH